MFEETNSQLRLFIQESQNRVKLCLDDLETLEQDDPSKRTVAYERLLRTTRGIGGSARFHALPQLVRLCQALESFLGRFRGHLAHARPEFVSIVALVLKKIALLLEDPTRQQLPSIDQEVLAIQSMLAAHADPPEFNLAEYPQALATAITQGLDFYSLHLPLGGNPEANRNQFEQIKAAVEVVATLVATKPDLGAQFAWRDDIPGGMVRLLMSTVLPGEILHGLIQLPQERIVRLEVPDELRSAVSSELERLAKEAEVKRAQEWTRESEVEDLDHTEEWNDRIGGEEPVHADPLADAQLGVPEAQARQAHFEEMHRQEVALQEARRRQQAANDEVERKRQELTRRQTEERQRQEAEQSAVQDRRSGQRRWILGGLVVAGLVAVVAHQVDVAWWQGPLVPFLSSEPISRNSIDKGAPHVTESLPVQSSPTSDKPAAKASQALSSVAAPVALTTTVPPMQPAETPQESKAPAIPANTRDAADPQSPEKNKGDVPPLSPPMKEQNIQADVMVKSTESTNKASIPSDSVKLAKNNTSTSSSWQTEFARYDTKMLRVTKESYEKFKPAKNTKHGSLRVWRNRDGNMVFSIADMMGHSAIRPNETFTLTPDSMTELRLVLQVDRGHAYMFELDRNGEVIIPKTFWNPFSQATQKAVSISRVIQQGSDGVKLRDLTALSMSYIRRTAP
ncbi:MAG: hypothetical protein HQM04_13985 [Magnetococcales bacterium]|nr:hypothetical protein [Magnetococcales bacterium]